MKCVKCQQFFPPGMTIETTDGKANMCLFCEQDKSKLRFITNPETGESETYSKQHVIDEYKKYLKQVKENPNVKKLIVDDAIDKMKKET